MCLFSFSRELLDVAAYRFGYDVDLDGKKCNYNVTNKNNPDSFWNNPRTLNILLRLRFDEHCYLHAHSCFKKGCECRFFFPFMAQPEESQLFSDQKEKPPCSTPLMEANTKEWDLFARYLAGSYASERGSGYGWNTDHYGARNRVLRGGRLWPIHISDC